MYSINQTTQSFLSLVLTHECNRRCLFCADAYRGSGEFITLSNARRAVQFAVNNGISDVLVVGGEPTLHPDVLEIVAMVKDAGMRAIMTTNYSKPDMVRALDGLVDCFNISYYDQQALPKQKDFKSDLTLHTLIHGRQLATKKALDDFISDHRDHCHLKFSTLYACNEWAMKHQRVQYLDELECEWVVLFNEILGQRYRGAVIKRSDRVINARARQSWKAHVDGTISNTWERPARGPLLTLTTRHNFKLTSDKPPRSQKATNLSS